MLRRTCCQGEPVGLQTVIKRRKMYEKKFKGQKSNRDRTGIRYGNVACSLRQAGWIESGGTDRILLAFPIFSLVVPR